MISWKNSRAKNFVKSFLRFCGQLWEYGNSLQPNIYVLLSSKLKCLKIFGWDSSPNFLPKFVIVCPVCPVCPVWVVAFLFGKLSPWFVTWIFNFLRGAKYAWLLLVQHSTDSRHSIIVFTKNSLSAYQVSSSGNFLYSQWKSSWSENQHQHNRGNVAPFCLTNRYDWNENVPKIPKFSFWVKDKGFDGKFDSQKRRQHIWHFPWRSVLDLDFCIFSFFFLCHGIT